MNEGMYEWMNEGMNKWMNERMNGLKLFSIIFIQKIQKKKKIKIKLKIKIKKLNSFKPSRRNDSN